MSKSGDLVDILIKLDEAKDDATIRSLLDEAVVVNENLETEKDKRVAMLVNNDIVKYAFALRK